MASIDQEFAAFCAANPLHRLMIDGQPWEYLRAGAGPSTLLLLPGGFGVAASSFRYVAALAGPRCVISLHYPPAIDSIAGLCDGLAALLDQLGLEQAHILGGSASGFVAQALVRRHPRRVASLILAQTGAPRPARAQLSLACAALLGVVPMPLCFALLRFAIRLSLRDGGREHQFWRDHFAAVLAAQSRAALVNRFRLAADFDAHHTFRPHDLVGWPGHVALIEATHDALIGAGERATLRALYPRAASYKLPGGHNDSVEHPEAQIALIDTILRAYDALALVQVRQD